LGRLGFRFGLRKGICLQRLGIEGRDASRLRLRCGFLSRAHRVAHLHAFTIDY
jgi:hypothetical protein